MNQIFWVGIVESRKDPLKLGRVQVRIFGPHTESLDDIPTTSLPWAINIVNNSAGVSGIGFSGANYIEGSMVFGFFQDGESKQQPVVLGSSQGIPVANGAFDTVTGSLEESIGSVGGENPKVVSTIAPTSTNTLSDSSGKPVTDSSGETVKIGGVNANEKLKIALGKKESSNNYRAVNQLGYIGKYQMGAAMLTDLGYVKKGTKNSGLGDSANWTGKGGITSKDAWLNNGAEQETAMDAELVMNEKRLTKMGVIDNNTTAQEKAGYLATSHLLGTGGARDMKNGVTKADANGVTGQAYYKLGYAAVAGSEPVVTPDKNTEDNPSREKSTVPDVGSVAGGSVAGDKPKAKTVTSKINKNVGFSDPLGIYPKYINEQDTNRLARNQNISKTIVPQKEETEVKGVPIAGGGTWDQSSNPYNAEYPYNKVFESESGHLLEFDDTPGNERTHLYHKSGTFQEVDRNGTEVRKIVGDKYEIWERNGYVLVKGTVNITIEGDANVMVSNNCELDIGGDLNAKIGGNANWSVGGDWMLKTGGSEHHSNGSSFAVDSTKVDLNSGVSNAGSLPSTSNTASGAPNFPTLILEPRGFAELSDFESDELSVEQAETRSAELQNNGLTDVNPVPPTVEEAKTEKVEPTKTTGLPVECSAFVSGKINVNEYISPNFRLSDLTKGANITGQSGLTDTEIACNLKMLAVNILEPVKKKYPDMIITSGLRPMGANKNSQHPLGMAVDVQFTSKKSADYLAIAKDIFSSVPTDQLILEYRSDRRRNGEPTTWIHMSFSSKGNRKQTFTMDNDKRISDFGVLKLIT